MEIWKDIKGYEACYQVSNYGNVKSIDRVIQGGRWGTERRKGQPVTQALDRNGYSICRLWKNNKGKNLKVHRLVCIAFIPNPESKPTVNHKDRVKTNNFLTNLEWFTHKEQTKHWRENR